MAHVRAVVVWNGQLLLVQHHDPRDGVTFWMPPGGGSAAGEMPEDAARREVREETGVAVRILRRAPVRPGRDHLLFVAELAGPPEVTPEIEDCGCAIEIHTIGAAWHPVTDAAPLGPLELEHWSELAPLIRERLRATSA